MPFVVQLLIVLGSAVAYGWSFPPAPRPWLAWIALAPLFVTLRKVTAPRAVLLAWIWTVTMAYTVNDWFPRAVSGYFEQPFSIGIGLFLGVSTLTAAVPYMAFAAVQKPLAGRPLVIRPLLAAAAWVSADLARLRLFGGDPWAIIGYSQVGSQRLVQIADATGVHGLTFIIVSANAALAELWMASRATRSTAALPAVATAALGGALALAYGTVRLDEFATEPPPQRSVGIVQANIALGAQWRREFYGLELDRYLRESFDILRLHHPALLLWPESAMTFFVADEPSYRAAIASVLKPFDAELIAGGVYSPAHGDPPYSNSAFLLSPGGDILGRYDKQLLLPFAEYLPLEGIDLLRRNFGRVREFTPGGDARVLDTRIGRVGIVLCNEAFFPEPAAVRVRAGATVLVNLSNDSWLADAKYSTPAFDMVVLRAIEQRRWLVRASTAGPSALVDPSGRVRASTRLLAADTLVGNVAARGGRTLYNRIGDSFAWLCVVVTAIAAVAPRRRVWFQDVRPLDDAA
jgi:apolipoprotein N-acyltransferase